MPLTSKPVDDPAVTPDTSFDPAGTPPPASADFDPASGPGTSDPNDQAKQPDEGQPAALLTPNIPPPADAEKAWQNHAVEAIQALYPHLRRGVDYEYGRSRDDPEGEPKILSWDEKFAPADEGKIKELAQKLAEKNPYADYKPLPTLASSPSKVDPGEVQYDSQGKAIPPVEPRPTPDYRQPVAPAAPEAPVEPAPDEQPAA